MARVASWGLVTSVVFLFCVVAASAQDKPAPAPMAQKAEVKDKPVAHPGLAKLKKLAGEWVSAETPAPTTQPAGEREGAPDPNRDREGAAEDAASQPICVYRVVSAGSVVQETLFPGTPHEMVTMYYQEGPDLVLTHYCAMGNQPRMKAEPFTDAGKLEFKFAGGSNIDPGKDGHMHDLTLTFVDADHLRAEWTLYRDGKQSGVKTFDLQRKK